MFRILFAIIALNAGTAAAQDLLDVHIAFLGQKEDALPPLSLLDPEIEDYGLPGAVQATSENRTTGRFTGQNFELHEHLLEEDEDVIEALEEIAAANVRLVVSDLPARQLLAVADLEAARDMLIFNARAQDDELRSQECRANVLHVAPSRSMLTDGLAQYLAWKRWDRWALITGQTEDDAAYAEAVKRSARRFGAEIVEEKDWTFVTGGGRTDTGHVTAQQEVPSATRLGDYDVLIVADEADQFGEYLPYRTYLPRPVAGTQGLVPTSWHRSHEQWGGTQLQRRFARSAGRDMTPRDYAAWVAVRAIGEATTKISDAGPAAIREYLLSEDFTLAAFKGVPLSFRNWNGQMRQPVLVVAPRMLVTVSPQEQFLHQFNELDTLGLDRPESGCDSFE